MQKIIYSAEAMEAFGAEIGTQFTGGEIIFLKGELGAGKTTLVRGVLRGLGHSDKVKSPTYTIVEMYELAQFTVYHFDLYRLNDPMELEDMGIRDYCNAKAVCLFEWPERGQGIMNEHDLFIEIDHLDEGRQVNLSSHSDRGTRLLKAL